MRTRGAGLSLIPLLCFPPVFAQEAAPTPAELYTRHCAACHDGRVRRAPEKWFLQMMPADLLLAAMDSGVMRQQASALSAEQRMQVAEYLAGAPAHGGPFAGAGGPMVVDGRLYVNSGYGHSHPMPGNVLLVFAAGR